MKIVIFGLGYVGCVSMGCLAELGNYVIGVDLSDVKVDLINQGKPTIIENSIDELISQNHLKGILSATKDSFSAVQESNISIICVGTPSMDNGHLNMEFVKHCAEQIGIALKDKTEFHTVVIRSTVLPGTNSMVGEIIANLSGKNINEGFGVVSNPEFLREGSAVFDYFHPPFTVLGSTSTKSLGVMKEVYKDIPGELLETEVGVAEIIKYVNNSYHALKITFANEIGNVCKKLDIDSHTVMNVFCKDKQLNISDYYFKPGFAYGGSCLPKDLGAMVALAKDMDLKANVLSSIDDSNENQKRLAYNMICNVGREKVGLIGISFKQGTDDLRFSPMVDILKWLIRDEFTVKVYDENVRVSLLMGANREYVEDVVPILPNLICDSLEKVIKDSFIVVISQKNEHLPDLIAQYPYKHYVDFIRLDIHNSLPNYHGLCW